MSVLFSFMLALATFLFFPILKYWIQFASSKDLISHCLYGLSIFHSFTLNSQTSFLTDSYTLKSFIEFYCCHKFILTSSLKVIPVYYH